MRVRLAMNNKIGYIALFGFLVVLSFTHWFKQQLVQERASQADLLMLIERKISYLMAQDIQLMPKQLRDLSSQAQQLTELQQAIKQYQALVDGLPQYNSTKHQHFLVVSYAFLEEYKYFTDLKVDIDQAFFQYSQLSTQLKDNHQLAPYIVQLSSSLLLYQLRFTPSAKQQAQQVAQFLTQSADEPSFRSLYRTLWQMVSYAGFLLEHLEQQEIQLIKLKNNPMISLLDQLLNYHDESLQSYQQLETYVVGASIAIMLALVLFIILRKNRELSHKSLQAEAATQAKSQFLANMSHEIRTPMNAIIGFTDLVIQTKLSKKQEDFVQKIKISAESLLLIINDILDFSKIEAGKLEIDNTPFDLTKQLDLLCNMFARRCEEKEIEMIIDDHSELSYQLMGDPLRLNQILINLVSNAIKFTDKGQVIIKIEKLSGPSTQEKPLAQNVQTLAHEKEVTLRFSVSDNGVGIPLDKQHRLFQAFAQADSTTTRQFGGTGLGLSICKRLVELMGGTIEVTSEFGKGSCFSFNLPFELELMESACERAPHLLGKHIVLVDDNPLVGDVVEYMLKPTQADVIVFNSASAALTYLAKQPLCDLLVVDWCMPEMNGIELAKHLRLIPVYQALPVVIITAFGNDKIHQQAIQIDAKGFLIKPFTIYGLWKAVSQAIGLYHQPQISQPQSNHVINLQSAKVLLVEDNKINQLLAKELLSKTQMDIKVASNGQQAVAMVEKYPFDIVLMDVQMPVMDGYEATRKIRQQYYTKEELPIIAMTANAMKGDKEHCLAAGMNDYVAKPIKKEQLLDALQRQLVVSNRQRESLSITASSKRGNKQSINYMSGSNVEDDKVYSILDIEDAISRLGGDQGMYRNLLKMFIADYAKMAMVIVENIHSQSFVQAVGNAHALKGVAANLSAIQLQQVAATIEQQLRDQQVPTEATLSALIRASDQTMEAIDQYCYRQEVVH